RPDLSYQLGNLTAALRHVTNHDAAIDGGAHTGTWSKVMSGHFSRVIAIEPSRDTFECLTSNMERFGCVNVECKNVALGAAAGYVELPHEVVEVFLKAHSYGLAEAISCDQIWVPN